MIEQLMLTTTPIIVNFLMNLIKKVPGYNQIQDTTLKIQLRSIAYVLSVASVLLTSYVSDSVDFTSIQTLLVGAVEFVLSQGTYLLFFKKK